MHVYMVKRSVWHAMIEYQKKSHFRSPCIYSLCRCILSEVESERHYFVTIFRSGEALRDLETGQRICQTLTANITMFFLALKRCVR